MSVSKFCSTICAAVLFGVGFTSSYAATVDSNLITKEAGAKVIGFSSEFGGWGAENMVPSLTQLREKGVVIEDFVWCTADNAPFPHWVLIELPAKKWVTSLVFNNALKEESAYPGISARQLEVWAGAENSQSLKKVATFQLEKNKVGQAVQIEPTELRWIKFVITSNWGNPTWTEMNAFAAYDDGTRPARIADELKRKGAVDLYGIYFDFGSAMMRVESGPVLTELVNLLKATPSLNLVIEGHTDSVGSKTTNQALSQRRAEAVVSELVRAGIPASRLSAKGFGSDQPVASNSSEIGRAKNRRVTVRVRP